MLKYYSKGNVLFKESVLFLSIPVKDESDKMLAWGWILHNPRNILVVFSQVLQSENVYIFGFICCKNALGLLSLEVIFKFW